MEPVFDPTKKYGQVCGNSVLFPNAKFSQGGYLFDSKHKCINPPEVSDSPGVPPPPPPISEADTKRYKRLQKELNTATVKLQKAKQTYNLIGSPAKKAVLTRATKSYDASFSAFNKFCTDCGIK